MNKKIINLDETEIEEYKFHQCKSPISIKNIVIDKIVVSNEFTFRKQDFNRLYVFIMSRTRFRFGQLD